MQKPGQLFATIALATAAAIFCSGCPALMVPGLAYSGYKYERDKNQPAASASPAPSTQSSKSSTAQSDKSPASQQQKIPDSEIE